MILFPNSQTLQSNINDYQDHTSSPTVDMLVFESNINSKFQFKYDGAKAQTINNFYKNNNIELNRLFKVRNILNRPQYYTSTDVNGNTT